MSTIFSFVPMAQLAEMQDSLQSLLNSPQIQRVFVPEGGATEHSKLQHFNFQNLNSTYELLTVAEASKGADYILLFTQQRPIVLGQHAIQRLLSVATDTDAGLVYSDYIERKNGSLEFHPLIEYQEGSLRDDFNFGSVLLYKASAFREAVVKIDTTLQHSALYATRLQISICNDIFHLPEPLYTLEESDLRKTGQRIFDYVDPKNRAVQIEMETVVTQHLKEVDAFLPPTFREVEFQESDFEQKASVVIPVRNREKTIGDAIESVLMQKTNFPFNIIVVNNHSADTTSQIIDDATKKSDKVIHIQPKRTDHGIGGCWNVGAHHHKCGMFVIQLDSDDIYKDKNTLQKIVDAFYQQQCAMVVGSYELVNFELEEIPPGLIDHKEWTPDNGRNNALRINGLGAPRAFYTPILREIQLPNTSYGEDYALGLAISRHYQIGRIYDSLYLCRRWDGNSDAALDIVKENKNNLYKDKIRTIELKARKQLVSKTKA